MGCGSGHSCLHTTVGCSTCFPPPPERCCWAHSRYKGIRQKCSTLGTFSPLGKKDIFSLYKVVLVAELFYVWMEVGYVSTVPV